MDLDLVIFDDFPHESVLYDEPYYLDVQVKVKGTIVRRLRHHELPLQDQPYLIAILCRTLKSYRANIVVLGIVERLGKFTFEQCECVILLDLSFVFDEVHIVEIVHDLDKLTALAMILVVVKDLGKSYRELIH